MGSLLISLATIIRLMPNIIMILIMFIFITATAMVTATKPYNTWTQIVIATHTKLVKRI